ncbi:thiamine biosynthesis protein ThiS [Vulcanimicrobium alpinum]|uniref:Thiamine biosynthesis protein ThiS n=1 Tax=Vulcanimicrobium alpinum TaxID=3016050 RepID=A0AAN1XUF0_UNVUL|nr:sulfur carrier protein ThiS [Vulcanimicrobium alpinum]BDE05701.1 thiamine biosynthesis protein ThiS [Vulcanimicrobium alpinum]
MTVSINGESREVADGATLASLLDMLGVRRDGTAVALNDDVVPRARHDDTRVRDGDRLEIIVAVAGG